MARVLFDENEWWPVWEPTDHRFSGTVELELTESEILYMENSFRNFNNTQDFLKSKIKEAKAAIKQKEEDNDQRTN